MTALDGPEHPGALSTMCHIDMKERMFCRDVDLLLVGLRTFYCTGSSYTPLLQLFA